MWDTHTTDYRVTGQECPFHRHKHADITKELFDAFRAKGLGISAYFSKADWHTPYYWAPGMEAGSFTSRGPSYDPKKYPWLWEQFVQFTHEQIMELMTRYGRIDVLWLDAGWVNDYRDQNIRLGEVVEKAREIQPWLLSADRTVGGPYENLITPEQTLPERALHVPWESCITMGTSFSFRYEDRYKTVRQLIHLLAEIVAKGGNLALNVGPQPDGRLPETAISRMKGMGEWLKVYGEAIYGTRVCEPYSSGAVQFTQKAIRPTPSICIEMSKKLFLRSCTFRFRRRSAALIWSGVRRRWTIAARTMASRSGFRIRSVRGWRRSRMYCGFVKRRVI